MDEKCEVCGEQATQAYVDVQETSCGEEGHAYCEWKHYKIIKRRYRCVDHPSKGEETKSELCASEDNARLRALLADRSTNGRA